MISYVFQLLQPLNTVIVDIDWNMYELGMFFLPEFGTLQQGSSGTCVLFTTASGYILNISWWLCHCIKSILAVTSDKLGYGM